MARPDEAPVPTPLVPRLDLAYDDIEQVEPLGQGGNADVHLGRVVVDGAELEVALKQPRMQGTLHQETVDRFREEAETWASLDEHDHVVGVVDWGTTPLPWLALEYMDGGSLREQLDAAGGRFDLERAAWTALCVTRAVRHAHRHGVAHLDLKPENVLSRTPEPGKWPLPKVSDWGLARLMLDHTGSVDGLSPQYAAPEQFDADAYGSPDDFTDVYQLGAVTSELFAGRPPFVGSSTEVMQGVLNEEPAPPSAVADVPAAVDDVVMPALRKHKDERYDSVVYLRDALEELLAEFQTTDSGSTGSKAGGSRPSDADGTFGSESGNAGAAPTDTAGTSPDAGATPADAAAAAEQPVHEPEPAPAAEAAEPGPDSTATEATTQRSPDGSSPSTLRTAATVAGYGLLGVALAVLPVFLVDSSELSRAYPAMAGGLVVIVAAGLRATGRSGATTRGVAVFGTGVFLIGTVFLFIL